MDFFGWSAVGAEGHFRRCVVISQGERTNWEEVPGVCSLVDVPLVVSFDFEDGSELAVLAFEVRLLEDFEPEEMGNGFAERFFERVVAGADESFVDGLNDLGDGLLDLWGDVFQVKAAGSPERERGRRRGGGFGRGFSFLAGFFGMMRVASGLWLVVGGMRFILGSWREGILGRKLATRRIGDGDYTLRIVDWGLARWGVRFRSARFASCGRVHSSRNCVCEAFGPGRAVREGVLLASRHCLRASSGTDFVGFSIERGHPPHCHTVV